MQHLKTQTLQDPSVSPTVSPIPTTTVTVTPTTSSAPSTSPVPTTSAAPTTTEVVPPPFSEESGTQLLEQVKVMQAAVDELNAQPPQAVTIDTDQYTGIMIALGLLVLLAGFACVAVLRR